MSLPRFYLPPSDWSAELLVLQGDEAHHCASVMRRNIGDEIEVFDGQGRYANAEIVASSSKRVELRLTETLISAPPATELSLLQAIPKGANMELIIEKAVELGVSHIYPVISQRTVVKISGQDAEKKQVKWQRLALEACKQCRQNWLPVVHQPVSLEKSWENLPPHDLRVVAAIQDDAKSIKSTIHRDPKIKGKQIRTALVMIGPEGDFTPKEYEEARLQGCLPVTLGSIILKVETATMFCLSVLSHELSERHLDE